MIFMLWHFALVDLGVSIGAMGLPVKIRAFSCFEASLGMNQTDIQRFKPQSLQRDQFPRDTRTTNSIFGRLHKNSDLINEKGE